MNIKKGAMFGLDARIALAIFGALSVISGAALYGAIKDAKATAFLNQLEEVSKAIDAYRLDVGKDVVVSGTLGGSSDLGVLVKDYHTDRGWKGPYISFEESSSSTILNDNKVYTAKGSSDRNIAGVSTISNGTSCPTTSSCDIYIVVEFTSAEGNVSEGVDLYYTLDAKLDNSDGFKSGKIHAVQAGNNTTTPDPTASSFSIYYKAVPYVFR